MTMELPEQQKIIAPEPAAGAVNILVVDDDGRNLDVLETILASPELRLVRAKTAEDALLALVHEEFACIILDIQMPGMTGLDLARLIKTRKRNQHVPIIFLTAYFLEEEDALHGYGVGAVDYLTKPVNPRILKSKVGVFVDLFRTTRALAAANGALEAEIAQRKQVEETLRKVNSELELNGQKAKWQLAAIVESSDDAIVGKDINGVVTSWNRGAEKLFGYTADEVIGKSITLLIPPERLDEETEILRRIRAGKYVEHFETVRRRKDGTLIDVSLTISPIRDSEGKIVGASKIARDITDRKRIQEKLWRAHKELVAASRAKDDFLAMLSHELRTPLNPVLLLASDGENNRDLPPRARTDFNVIRKNIELEARLIDDLLDLTRVTRGKIFLEKKHLDVHQVLHDAIAQVQREIEQKQIVLTLKLNAARHGAMADAVRLQQIFWNLLKNAVKFTPDGGSITVETEIADGKLEVKITDTGIGMTDDEVGQVFNVFSNKRANGEGQNYGGLGLGLAISQKLAEIQSGQIRAMSQGRGKGSTFIVNLPLAEAISQADDQQPRINPGQDALTDLPERKGIRVLLVEDHEPTRTTLAHLLASRFYKVVTAASVAEARRLAGTQNFNLLISDIGLPDGNGYDLLVELRKENPIRGIALTGYGMEHDMARSQKAGFDTHLTKPVRIQHLEEALEATKKLMPV